MNNSELLKIFASTSLETFSTRYSVVNFSLKNWDILVKDLDPKDFVAVTHNKKGQMTIVLDTVVWEKRAANSDLECEVSNNWRHLMVSGEQLLEIVGYLAKLSLLLAQNNISILAFTTDSKSHLLVLDKDYKKAKAILKIFLSQPTL